MASALSVISIFVFVLALVGLGASDSLGARFQSIVTLALGLLLFGVALAGSVAFGSWLWVGIGIGAVMTGFGAFSAWRERHGAFVRPTRRHWITWSLVIAGLGLLAFIGTEIGFWSFLVVPVAFALWLTFQRGRRDNLPADRTAGR